MNKLSKQEEERLREEELAIAILEYLAEHPKASDTLEGIAEWWIMRQQIRVEINKLEKVLHHLIQRGLLEKIGEGDKARYCLKAEGGQPRFKADQSLRAISRKHRQEGNKE